MEHSDVETTVVARSYQLELLRRAKDGNVIAVLDTGTGKTLISVLLIKHMASLEESRQTKRISIFLVPLVPLVLQQESYIRHNCNLTVKHYYGAMGVDEWTMERWNEELEATDVMVMTADIFRNVLHRAYIKMERVNLVIFDEAHHARKNHSYNQIMANHYQQCPVQLRPKIFGMTASPTFGKESSHNSIKQLEVNLASKAFTVAPEDMTAHVRRPEESIVYYKNGPFPNPPPLYYLIANPKVAGPAMELLAAPLNESLAFCEELGPWCAERALEQAIVDADIRMQRKAFQRKHNAHLRVDVDEAKEDAILTNVANIKNYILRSAHWGSNAPPPTVKTLSPKVIALIKVLEEYRDEADRFCGIIFVERRATANVLHKAIKKWKGLAFLKSEVLVGHGHGSGNPVDINMSVQQQKQVVQAFQEGRANLLIATRVAEEGLDIKACMLVIRFDTGGTLTNYIQSRGRARHAASRFVILSDRDKPVEAIQIAALQREEEAMRTALRQRDELREDDRDYRPALQPGPDEVFIVESTGASVTLYTAIGVLFHYCALLPKDTYSDMRPIFQINPMSAWFGSNAINGFKASVTLPLCVPMEARYVIGKTAGTKAMAKRWASFEAIKRLHAVGELDDHLKPLKITSVLDVGINIEPKSKKGKAKTNGKGHRQVLEYHMKAPTWFTGAWEDDQAVHMAILTMQVKGENARTLGYGFLTPGREPLPHAETDMFLANQHVTLTVTPLKHKLQLETPELLTVKRFHSTLFKAMLRSDVPDQADWALLIVPLANQLIGSSLIDESMNPLDCIDWAVVDVAGGDSISVLDTPGFLQRPDIADFILLDRVQYSRKYLIEKVLHDTTPFTSFPMAKEKFPNVHTFYKIRLRCDEPIIAEQPIIEAKPLPNITQNIRERQSTISTYLIPQFCTVYPIPSRLLQGDALHLPIIMQHIQHWLLTMDLKHREINQELKASVYDLQAALTAPVANPLVNYERLETLGDSFLKVHQSLHLFATQPTWHEGRLSEMRNQLEQNSALRLRAMELGLEEYILGTPLSRKEWTPPLQNGGGTIHKLSDKTVADVVEAIFGASVVGGGVRGGAEAVKALLGGGYEVDWTRYSQQYKAKRNAGAIKGLTRTIRTVEERIGYTFSDKSLAMEALTHASALQMAAEVDCYQRLEFLGDSVLGFVITRHLFGLSPPLTPGHLSDFRSELVNNQFLSCVSWTLGLPKLLEHMDSRLANAIAQFGAHLQACAGSKTQTRGLYWNDWDSAPKAAGDVYEAMLGAAFADSGFDVDIVWQIVERTLIKPWWAHFEEAGMSKISADGEEGTYHYELATNPNQQVSEWLQNVGCTEFDISTETLETGATICTFKCHADIIGQGEGTNKRAAKRVAASKAITVLRSNENICTCQTIADENWMN